MSIAESNPQRNTLPARVYSAAVAVTWSMRRNGDVGVAELSRQSGKTRQHVYRARDLAAELQPIVDSLATDDDLRRYLAGLPIADAGVTDADVEALREGSHVQRG